MKLLSSGRPLLFSLAAFALFVGTAAANADTFPLERKALPERAERWYPPKPGSDFLYRMTSSQHFWMQTGVEQPQPEGASFASLIKKEPKYACKHPFRFVAKLGSDSYGCVLDASKGE